MMARIDVTTRQEATAIRAALTDPQIRAFVVTMGTLQQLPSDQSRLRVLRYVSDRLDERDMNRALAAKELPPIAPEEP